MRQIDRRAITAGLMGLPLLTASSQVRAATTGARPGPFLLGADISWIPQDEADGAT
jgi:arabinogalactan endo-1,4-beta-galactosidase